MIFALQGHDIVDVLCQMVQEDYLGLKCKVQEAVEKRMLRNFITCSFHS